MRPDEESHRADASSSSDAAPAATHAAAKEFAPFSFAILLDNPDREIGRISATTDIPPGPVQTAAGRFAIYPLDDNLDVGNVEIAGKRYAVVETKPDARISWNEIQGHVLAQQFSYGGREPYIDLQFDEELAAKLKRLSEKYIHRRLAIIFNGRIISAPLISSPFGKMVRITGRFTPQERRFLMQALMGGLVDPLDVDAGEPAASDKSDLEDAATRQLRQLALGLISYESVHGHFPASAATSRNGTRTEPYSWRVAILPFINRQDLYQQYRFDEPWSSEHNRKLIDQMPDIFRSPLAPQDQEPGGTNYFGFVGDQSALGFSDGVKLRDIKDGTSNTVLIVETKVTNPWTKPQDLKYAEPRDARGAEPLSQDGVLRVAFADGSTQTIDPANWRKLSKMITRAGGERIE